MKKTFFPILFGLCFVFACSKDKTPERQTQQVFLDVPFMLSSKSDCVLSDSFFNSSANSTITQKVVASLKGVKDYRAFGYGCSVSTGGYAEVAIVLSFNDTLTNYCVKSFPGCTNTNEWDTVNSMAPKCAIDIYKFYLLKLYPATGVSANETLPNNLEDYSVKCVFKKL